MKALTRDSKYQTPKVEVLDICIEGILCGSIQSDMDEDSDIESTYWD